MPIRRLIVCTLLVAVPAMVLGLLVLVVGSRFLLRDRGKGAAVEAPLRHFGAEFTIPKVNVRTGLALTDADPGDDGQDPTPVHAYAAAGGNAPRIERTATDRSPDRKEHQQQRQDRGNAHLG